MADPTAGAVVPGTGGLRKLRFAPKSWKRGKSGAARVGYVYFPDHFVVLLVLVYGKGDKLDLSEDDKKGVKKYIERVKRSLDKKKFT